MSVKRKLGDVEAYIDTSPGGVTARTDSGLDYTSLYKPIETIGHRVALLRPVPPPPGPDPALRKVTCSVEVFDLLSKKKRRNGETVCQTIERLIREAPDAR